MRLVLDAHISPVVAQSLAANGIDAVCLRDWQTGKYLHASDEEILTAAALDVRVLVTYDARSLLRIATERVARGEKHTGLIVVDTKTCRPNDIGGLIKMLTAYVAQTGAEDWLNRADYLRPIQT